MAGIKGRDPEGVGQEKAQDHNAPLTVAFERWIIKPGVPNQWGLGWYDQSSDGRRWACHECKIEGYAEPGKSKRDLKYHFLAYHFNISSINAGVDARPLQEAPSYSANAGAEAPAVGRRVEGVGPEQPVYINEAGGKQSVSPYRLDLLPPLAILEVAKILKKGADKYGAWNWLQIQSDDHLNHMMQHVMAAIAGDTSEVDPLEHARQAVCRAMFWLEMLLREREPDAAKVRLDPELTKVTERYARSLGFHLDHER